MSIENFNLRVYGLLIHNDAILVTVEHRAGIQMVKFPGGGLEKGEGIENCLIREFDEELSIGVKVTDFYYVNEFLQKSTFNSKEQLISFYYKVDTSFLDEIKTTDFPVNLNPGVQVFIWVELSELNGIDFTFPIDKIVAEKLSMGFLT